jgi:hypothetical protein
MKAALPLGGDQQDGDNKRYAPLRDQAKSSFIEVHIYHPPA